MKNWRLIDDEYINFDHLEKIHARATAWGSFKSCAEISGWGIFCYRTDKDNTKFKLFNEDFPTKMEAVNFLCEFMNRKE